MLAMWKDKPLPGERLGYKRRKTFFLLAKLPPPALESPSQNVERGVIMGRVIPLKNQATQNLSQNDARRMAEEEYSRSILEGLGLFMIAEAWQIKPYAVTQYEGHGALTEAYVLDQMTQTIMKMYAASPWQIENIDDGYIALRST